MLGYGFGDDHINHIIESALMNPSLVMLVVEPNPKSGTIDRVRRYKDLGKRAFVLTQTEAAFGATKFKLASFDDFARSIMPDVQWLDDFLRLRRFEKQIQASHIAPQGSEEDWPTPTNSDGKSPHYRPHRGGPRLPGEGRGTSETNPLRGRRWTAFRKLSQSTRISHSPLALVSSSLGSSPISNLRESYDPATGDDLTLELMKPRRVANVQLLGTIEQDERKASSVPGSLSCQPLIPRRKSGPRNSEGGLRNAAPTK